MYSVKPNDITLRYYFYFMQERMNMFWRKCQNPDSYEWTNDPILRKYKFTNVYRATDRVSQYLIRNVIYADMNARPEDVMLRVLVFKVFNKIETWEYLKEHLDAPITVDNFDPQKIARILTTCQRNQPIFSNAYMMTGSHAKYDYLSTKHEKWLTMLKKEVVDTMLLARLQKLGGLGEMYEVLHDCSFIGPFLAYQYAIDLNYTPYFEFSENEFVKAGIGAIRGIKKCFVDYGENYEDAIRYVAEHLENLQERYDCTDFKPLPGHQPTLIDLQNCFCETDKYLRAKMPELKVDNVRIKQTYKCVGTPVEYMFPRQWHIKEHISYSPRLTTLF